MAYLLEASEKAGPGLRRVLREQNARILALLTNWTADPADAIHRARQGCKRARAAVRLLRTAAPYVAMVENAFYRDIQRRIAYARDIDAIVEAIDRVALGPSEPRLAESVAMWRQSLASRAVRELESRRSELAAEISRSCALLEAADARLKTLPLADLRKRDLRRAVGRSWHHCARHWRSLAPEAGAEAFHAWRRRVKYLASQAELLAVIEPGRAAARSRQLRRLGAQLGHCQDLELLAALLRTQPDTLHIDIHAQRMRRLVAAALAEHRCRALALGQDVFGDGAPLRITEQQQFGKEAAMASGEDPASPSRLLTRDRAPDPPRRRQHR